MNDVLDDITKFMEETRSLDSVDSILLYSSMNKTDHRFDKKYSVQRDRYLIETFPVVLVAHRIKFWPR